jgi:hypothetical protein
VEVLKDQIDAIRRSRVVHDCTIPETLRGDGVTPKKITLQQLSAEQELMASRLGRDQYLKSQYAAVKLSIVEMDGKPADHTNGGVDAFWDRTSPKVRALLLTAHNKLSSPSKEEEDSFLKSMTVRV